MTRRLAGAGPIGWMARHGVAPNLLMLLLVLGGLLFATRITQEVFPSYETDTVTVYVALPGATPEEVEQSITLPIEEELDAIEGIDELTSSAKEGSTSIVAEIAPERDRQAVYAEIRQAVDRVSLPQDAEDPIVRLVVPKRQVIELQIYGEADRHALRMAAERLRERLLLEDGISQVELAGTRELEIHVEVPQAALVAHGLTLEEVAARIRQSALDRAGGNLETRGEDLLLRLADRRELPREFADIPLIADARGPVLTLGEVATVRRGFSSADLYATYDGAPSLELDVYRTGDETPITVSDAVRDALPRAMVGLPETFGVAITEDDAEIYRGRLDLLLTNGFIGLLLVLLVLSLFLKYQVAFWVAVGIPTAFLGTFLVLPATGASINMVTMFAFIMALGIVVDDAIVVGENIYEYMQRGMSRLEAAIQGARDIATPLAFSILTNIAAFLPLALVPGAFGKFFIWIPVVVATAFLLSWIEALFVLPAHLAAIRAREAERPPNRLERIQRRFSAGLSFVIERIYRPALRLTLAWRYATAAAMVGLAMIVMAYPMSGQMGFSLFPPVPRDYATLTIHLPVNAPNPLAVEVRDRVVAAAQRTIEENGGDELARGVHGLVEGNRITVRAYLQGPETRPISTARFAELWRETLGPVPEARTARYSSSFGGPGGASGIEVELSHPETEALEAAAEDLARALRQFSAVRDIDSGFTPGKTEIAFRLTEAGRTLGLTSEEIGRQVRAAFGGVEALAQQEGRNEVTLRVRLPEEERSSEADLERLLIRTPDGGEVPLYQIATVERAVTEAQIERKEGRRILSVTAELADDSRANRIQTALEEEILPQLRADHPGLGTGFGGRQEQQAEMIETFRTFSIPLTLALIYALLAIPFRSYIQPLIVMAAIPFGIVGAVLGHMLMGMSLSMISIFGVIALAGVVINAAIVMIAYANEAREAGLSAFEAIWQAGVRRFRPIVLTTLTTFGGLAPMIFETSAQAKFLIPMAVSLGYGILFATLIVLFLIPALYLILEDLRWLANPPGRRDEAAAGGRGPAPVQPSRPVAGE